MSSPIKIILIFLLFATQIFAAPAFNRLREFKQCDGTTFQARAFGNQHLNWIESEDGEVLKYNQKSNNFEYAIIKERQLKASGTAYEKNNSKRARSIGHVNKLNKEDIYRLWSEKQRESTHLKHRNP